MYVCIYVCCLFIELGLSDTAQDELPELDAFVTFYEKICSTLPTDELLSKLVTQRVITVNDKSKIAAMGKTECERAQYLLDHYIARPLSVGDPSFFNILLDLMSTTLKCTFLKDEIQQYLSTKLKHKKFSGEFTHTHRRSPTHTHTHTLLLLLLLLLLSILSWTGLHKRLGLQTCSPTNIQIQTHIPYLTIYTHTYRYTNYLLHKL